MKIIATLAIIPLSLCAISEMEVTHLAQNAQEIYLYCDKDHSKMADVIAEISKLDNDRNSPTWQLHNYIKRGWSIGKEDAIVEALEDAEKTLEKNYKAFTNDKIAQIQTTLNSVIDAVTSGKLTIDIQSVLNKPTTQSVLHRTLLDTCDPDQSLKIHTIKLREKLYALESAKFFKDVTFKGDVTFEDDVKFEDKVKFKENVAIEGTLTVADEVVTCDLTVGCNINMHDSIDDTIGNIVKDGDSFIHNFGADNTFVGRLAGNFTMTGFENTGFGDFALTSNTSGDLNAASGFISMASNLNGSVNTAHGAVSLTSNTSGDANVAIGFIAMASNTTGSGNVGIGIGALVNNTTGEANTAVGAGALSSNITGSGNVALGVNAGDNLVSGDDNIYIANGGNATETGFIRIGTLGTHTAAFMQGIFSASVAGGALPVEVDSTGKLGTTVSSQIFKQDITEMGVESEKIYDLHPVTFSYINDDQHATQYGLIAEEVAKVFPSLVVSDASNNPLAVRYQVLPTLLLNEVQKQQAWITNLAERVAHLEAAAAA